MFKTQIYLNWISNIATIRSQKSFGGSLELVYIWYNILEDEL